MSYLRIVGRPSLPAKHNPEESVRLSLLNMKNAEKAVMKARSDLELSVACAFHRQARRQLAKAVKLVETQS
jgi:hypothetical protein